MIRGFFRDNAGFINAYLISRLINLSEAVEFLVDTGASRTTLLDKDAIHLGIEYSKLKRFKESLSGIGGSVETYIIEDAWLFFNGYKLSLPVLVVRHPLEEMSWEERIKVLRIPSVLGRDVIAGFRLIFDKARGGLFLE